MRVNAVLVNQSLWLVITGYSSWAQPHRGGGGGGGGGRSYSFMHRDVASTIYDRLMKKYETLLTQRDGKMQHGINNVIKFGHFIQTGNFSFLNKLYSALKQN